MRQFVSLAETLICVLLTAPLNSPDQDSQISAYSWKEIDKSTGMDVRECTNMSAAPQNKLTTTKSGHPLHSKGKKSYIFFSPVSRGTHKNTWT